MFWEYSKVVTVRNPYSLLLGACWKNYGKTPRTHRIFEKTMKDFECRERYHGIDEYDLTRGQCGVWLINDDYVIDHHIRFEQLERDIKKFCKTTGSALLDLANERSDYVNRVTKKITILTLLSKAQKIIITTIIPNTFLLL